MVTPTTGGRTVRAERRLPILSLLSLTLVAACGGEDVTGPDAPAGALQFSKIASGYFHTCALTLQGQAYCWGGNTFGSLGDGTTTASNRPVQVGGGLRFTSLEAGAGHTCGLSTDGRIYCWGINDEGQDGDDYFIPRFEEPHLLPGTRTWTAVSAGHDHTCGLTTGGEAWCWGGNIRGQLGSGATDQRSYEPMRVAAGFTFTEVVAGYYQSCGLDEGGKAFCWGRNDAGQLGDGTTEDRFTPVPVAGDRAFRTLAGGDAFICGITTGGASYCWGSNRNGEVGDPQAASPQVVPINVEGAPEFAQVYAAGGAWSVTSAQAYGCGLTDGGEAWCWGGSIRGDLWEGPTGGAIRIAPDIRFRALAPGAEHLCGLTTDGYAFCGGGNYVGQLGDGTSADRASMVGVIRP